MLGLQISPSVWLIIVSKSRKTSGPLFLWLTEIKHWPEMCKPFKCQPQKMIKHTQTIRWLLPTSCLSVFDHFVGLALRGLKTCSCNAFNLHSSKMYFNLNSREFEQMLHSNIEILLLRRFVLLFLYTYENYAQFIRQTFLTHGIKA